MKYNYSDPYGLRACHTVAAFQLMRESAMRNRKWKNGGERINIVWPVLVCGLALLFAVLSTSTILSMNQDLSALYEYPYLNAQHINRPPMQYR